MLNTILKTSKNVSQNIRCYGKRKIANPGIQKRINVLEEKNEANLDNIDVEELESDFMSVGQMHREHENELKHFKDKEKYWIVQRKYFKENKINFLTWNDQEQIRYLHQSNPAEWTVEKLADGFPASVDTITKIIKGKWQYKNELKKENHDKAVEKNWDLLKKGKLSEILPPKLCNHLLKFTSRKPSKDYQENKIIDVSPPKQGEFSSIINSYQQLKLKSNPTTTIQHQLPQRSENIELIDETLVSSYGNKMIPLSFIKKEVNTVKDDTHVNLEEVQLKKLFHGDENTSKNKYLITKSKEMTQNKSVIQYPEKIEIPKQKYKKGCTYKVNDCYYDDDGTFLYRVPGMY